MNSPTDSNPCIALDPTATAAAIRCSKGLLYKLWREGLGPPFVRVGSDRRVLLDDLRVWLVSRRVAA